MQDQSTDQSTDQPTDQSTNQLTNQSTSRSIERSTGHHLRVPCEPVFLKSKSKPNPAIQQIMDAFLNKT